MRAYLLAYLMVAIGALCSAPLSAHSASDCHVYLDVVDAKDVRLSLTLKASDVSDLFSVDLSQPGSVGRVRQLAHRDAGLWFKLRDDGGSCTALKAEVAGDAAVVHIAQPFSCTQADGPLRLDWGLSSISSLDLVAHVAVRREGEKDLAQELTRRRSTLKIPGASKSDVGSYAAIALILAASMAAALGLGRRRRS